MKKDFLWIGDLTRDEIVSLAGRALEIKREGRSDKRPLSGHTLGFVFDKASTRTRVSFEAAMTRLGGHTIFLSRADTQLSRDEEVKDTARVLSGYLDGLVVRTFSHALVEEVARWTTIPVINALTDRFHPCQILSDFVTILEKRGPIEGLKVAWIGDGNNVAHSWINLARILEFDLTLACPRGYYPDEAVMGGTGDNIRVVDDPARAARDADVINTDVWVSMGQDAERRERLEAFQGFQVNQALVDLGRSGVMVMHCLPAHRGEEITDEVMEGDRSVIFDQAENKMYLHQALLEMLMVKGQGL